MNESPATVTRFEFERRTECPCPFAIDRAVFRQDASEALRVSGWVLHPRQRVVAVHLGQGRDVLQSAPVATFRPRVAEIHADLPGSDAAGFELCREPVEPGEYWLEAELADGSRERLGHIRLLPGRQPRLMFMHIAKAAGSTLNTWFSQHYARDHQLVHIESEPLWRGRLPAIRNYEFISGHVGLPALRRFFYLRQYCLVTVVREPYAQTISHLAWIRRLAEPGEEARLGRHPEYIRHLSGRLAQCDFSRPGDLDRLIESLSAQERRLLDNCQVRYFSGPGDDWVTEEDLENARRACPLFDHIGLAEDLPGFMARVAADMGWPPPDETRRENVTRSFYGLDRTDKKLRDALEPLVRYDVQLYEFIRRKFVPGGAGASPV